MELPLHNFYGWSVPTSFDIDFVVDCGFNVDFIERHRFVILLTKCSTHEIFNEWKWTKMAQFRSRKSRNQKRDQKDTIALS